jgi:hypothetical protein
VDIHGNVKECSGDQMLEFSDETEHVILRKTTSSEIPSEFSLYPAFPNPFNPVTTITYNLNKQGYIELSIYNMAGQLVKTLHKGHAIPGLNQIQWNGTDVNGEPVSSGIYLCKMNSSDKTDFIKLVLMK